MAFITIRIEHHKQSSMWLQLVYYTDNPIKWGPFFQNMSWAEEKLMKPEGVTILLQVAKTYGF